MSRAIKIWLFIFLSTHSTFGSTPSTINRDDLVGPVRAPKTVVPGKFETFILELSNDFEHPLSFTVNLQKPASWHLLYDVSLIELAPGEKRNVIFVLEIDRACDIGEQTIIFEFYDEGHDVRLREAIVTEVEDLHEIEVLAVRKPTHITAGQEFVVDFEIRNLGNCYEKLIVNSDEGGIKDKPLTIAPNTTQYVSVVQRVPTDLTHVGYISSGLIIGVQYQENPIREVATLKAFPKSTKRSDPYNRLPIQASVIYFGAKNNSGFENSYQLEMKGAGFLDKSKRHEVDFVARGPNRYTIARVGNFDQYSARYSWQGSRTASTVIRVGDYAYNLTEITEMFRWARGLGITHTNNKLEVGGFINKPRFYSDVNYQYAAYGKYAFTKMLSAQLSALQKHYTATNSLATLGSFQTVLKLKKHTVSAEVSSGAQQAKVGYAGSLQADGAFDKFTYRTHTILAGPDYPGYYSNSIFSSTSLSYRTKKWGINTGVFYNSSNPAQDTIFTSAPYVINNSVGMSLFLNQHIQLQLSYIHRFKDDRFEDKKFSFRENATRYLVSYRKESWSAQLDGELAHTQNLLIKGDDNMGNTTSLRGRLEKTFLENLRIGTFGQYLYTNRYDRERTAFVLYGGHLSYQPFSALRVSAGYRNNYLLDEYYNDRTLLDFDVNVNYGNHSFSINTSHALVRNTVGRKDLYISARYTCRINAPISKRSGLYSLSGQISSKNPKDATGVIVNISGQSVISDQYGKFVVNDLPVGIHYIHLDRGTIGVGLITETDGPVEVEVLPRETNKVIVPLERAGSISGKIEYQLDERLERDGLKPPLKVIKASRGEVELLTYTDDEGNFGFKNLLPGLWTVRVVQHESAADTWVLAQNNLSVEVKPGQKATVVFDMKTKERKVRFSNQVLDVKIKK